MNRNEWKAAYGRARRKAKGRDCILAIGLQYWTMMQEGAFRTFRASIIRDRPISHLVAVELSWARMYRRSAAKWRGVREQASINVAGARACIADSRAIRAAASSFQALP